MSRLVATILAVFVVPWGAVWGERESQNCWASLSLLGAARSQATKPPCPHFIDGKWEN